MQQGNRWTLIISIVITILIATIGRLIPHLSNATPLASIALLSGFMFNKRAGLLIVSFSLLLSDILLSILHGYPIFGSWTIFSYSGFILITLFAPNLLSQHRYLKLSGYLVSITMLYWVWTNFGTWLLSGIYSHSIIGLEACFTMALPFLRHALLGNVLYTTLFLLCLRPAVNRLQQQMEP